MSDTAAPPKSKAVPTLLVIIAIVGVGLLIFMNKTPSGAGAGAGKDDRGGSHDTSHGSLGPTVHMESFVVQLKAVDVERYAHVTIDLEVGSEADRDHVGGMLPLVRDTIITFLIDQTVDDLKGSEGIAHLKEEVLTRLRRVLPGQRITNVFVTDFIVQ